MFFGLFGKDKEDKTDELNKIKSENDRVLIEMKSLAENLGQQAIEDQSDEISQRKYLNTLRREGRGPSL